MRFFVFFVAVLLTFVSTKIQSQDQGPQKVAGRTVAEWVADLESESELVRSRAVKSLGPFGKAAIGGLLTALDDKSPAVTYWACYHLGRVGNDAKAAVKKLKELQSGDSSAVVLAASFALCKIEKIDGNITHLTERLKSPERGMACSAAELLGEIGPPAKIAVPELEATLKRHDKTTGGKRPGIDYHVYGACQNALRRIQPGWSLKKK